ncbi:hypothetical protein BC833DRAFT_652343 [Globomyces pollinis-pini]|nr:hypothetical protein BC833DRAFT_652343 [Globomyces pollinis-pini]
MISSIVGFFVICSCIFTVRCIGLFLSIEKVLSNKYLNSNPKIEITAKSFLTPKVIQTKAKNIMEDNIWNTLSHNIFKF